MSENIRNSKRIAKNTFVLYVRMVIVMLVGFYTSRVVLEALGIEDFGLYNVVGGVVALFTFLRTSMEKCTQRFLNVEMAKNDGQLQKTFSVALAIHVIIALIAFGSAETVGLWFLNAHINIPEGREFAANCIYQTVVGGLVLIILTIPYSACIIAHEQMGIFALISVVDSFLNLFVAITLLRYSGDNLILYGALIFCIGVINLLLYIVYCRIKFEETKFSFVRDRTMYKQMLDYTSWTLLGHAMIIGSNQGNIILVNMFHGVAANAAMGVANQVNRQVLNLTNNFQTAFNPQITKAYAAADYEYLKKLVYGTSKISFFLLGIVSLPLFFNIDAVLGIWLKEVPEYSNIFCILMITSGILQALSSPLNFCVMASGHIKWFQITTGIVFISDLFILYALFVAGMPPATAMWVKLTIMSVVVWVRLYYANKEIPSITAGGYLTNVIFPLLCCAAISVGMAFVLMHFAETIPQKILATIAFVVISVIVAYIIGLKTQEKRMLKSFISFKGKK